MAVLQRPTAGTPDFSGGLFKRPTSTTGIISWITTIDHKRLGILYFISALFFFVVGGVEALLIRTQLAAADLQILDPHLYNQMFTMHGTTMVFLAVMPMSAAFFNYIVPLQIGARDVAFPRLNTFSFWTFFFGAVFLNSSWFLGGAPDVGWFGYAPLTSKAFNPGLAVDFWVVGLQILGISSLVAGFNFITTIINMRAPGMSMMKLPIFTWMTMVVQFLVILAFPAITIGLLELLMDRTAGTNFFEPAAGGLPIMWQHLFWVFGHPEVYILILPAFGIISEIIPVFSRKPLFGYPIMVVSGVVIGFLGFAVWSHHMFTTGLGAVTNAAFSITTMAIAIPTGVKIFNWIGTTWGGQLRFTTPMLFSLGLIFMFTIGGIAGVMHAAAPADAQQQDSYFIVAHFHYVLFGGSVFGLLAGVYYWFPKVTGRMMNDRIGKWVFWTLFLGFNGAFFPMYLAGLLGMARRHQTYLPESGLGPLNMMATIGAYIMALGILLLIIQLIHDLRNGEKAGNDPWDARTLEWMTPSPTPVYNFATLPQVNHRDQFWMEKYPEAAHGHAVQPAMRVVDNHELEEGVHLPGQSWYPFTMPLGIFIGAYGLVYGNLILALLGIVILFVSAFAWAFEGMGGSHVHVDLSKHPEVVMDMANDSKTHEVQA